MKRERIERKVPNRPRETAEILPLDPRDPDVVHAKELLAVERPRWKAA